MATNASEQVRSHEKAGLAGCPVQGIGERAMGCTLYDNCLYKAAVEDWDSFNCEQCRFEGRGAMEFIDPVFVPVIEDDLVFDETEMELIDLIFSLPSMDQIKENLVYNDEAA